MTDKVYAYETIGSTNEHARQLLADGEAPPFWVTAQTQSSGRGRNGRHWQSPAGNLYASYTCFVAVPPRIATQLSFVAALATANTAAHVMDHHDGRTLTLKWPNDVMLTGEKVVGEKVAGILLESWSVSADSLAIVIGIGINICHAPGGLNQRVGHLGLNPTTAITQQAFNCLSSHLHTWIELWNNGAGFAAIRTAWLSRAYAFGNLVTVNLNNGSLQGTFRGLDASGSLLLETEPGCLKTITAGDVSLLNETSARAHS